MVQGGSEIYHFMLLFEFCSLFLPMLKHNFFIYVFEVKETIFKDFEKTWPFVFSKNLILCQIKRWGRFYGCAQTLWKCWCFVNVEWKINHSQENSENLSTLHLFVWAWQPFEIRKNHAIGLHRGQQTFLLYISMGQVMNANKWVLRRPNEKELSAQTFRITFSRVYLTFCIYKTLKLLKVLSAPTKAPSQPKMT